MGLSVFPAPSSAGLTQKTQVFTSTGTFTTPSNVSSVELFLVAGGGGGGSNNSNDGAGGGVLLVLLRGRRGKKKVWWRWLF
jgi:hypothetical protein